MRRYLLAAVAIALLIMPVLTINAGPEQVWVDDLTAGSFDGLVGSGTITLAPNAPPAPAFVGDYPQAGSYLSSEHQFEAVVAAVVIDTDTTLTTGSAVRFDVRGKNPSGSWQMWQEAPRGGRIALERPSDVIQYRMWLLANGESPRARSVTLVAEWSDGMTIMAESQAPTYRIYATREGLVGHRTANGHIIRPYDQFVALPSWRALSSYRGYEYQVRVTYKGRSKVVPVWDVGPWNTRDDYWSTNRQSWKDLPRGLPEAQAAYYDGYNGGRDERGRRPNLPNGIDIADGTFWDLGIPDNAWVEVTFLWEGYDPGAGTPAATPTPNVTATPLPVALPPAGSILVDNRDNSFREMQGTWFDARCGFNGSHRWTKSVANESQVDNLGVWKAPITNPGFYEVIAYIPPCGEPATKNATYVIAHDGSNTKVRVDQEANQNKWYSLGVYYFKGGNEIRLDDVTGEEGLSVRYDAMAWLPRSDNTAPNATIIDVKDLGAGRYEVHWNGQDDSTGVASFDVQVQRNGGEWVDWLVTTTELKDTFIIDVNAADAENSTYGFRARARDWAGNTGEFPPNAQATSAEPLMIQQP